MNCGLPQRYGTQSYTVTQVGLGTIQEYILTLKAATGFEVIYEPGLTVQEMRRRGILKKSGR